MSGIDNKAQLDWWNETNLRMYICILYAVSYIEIAPKHFISPIIILGFQHLKVYGLRIRVVGFSFLGFGTLSWLFRGFEVLGLFTWASRFFRFLGLDF